MGDFGPQIYSRPCTRSILWPRAKHTEESYKHFIPVGILGSTMNGEQKKFPIKKKEILSHAFIRDCFRDRDRLQIRCTFFSSFSFFFFLFAVKWEHSIRSVTMSQKDFVFSRIPCDWMNMRFFREKGVEIYCFNAAKRIRFSFSRRQPTHGVFNVLFLSEKYPRNICQFFQMLTLFIIAVIIL